MKNVTEFFLSLVHWPSVGGIGLNTDILGTNIINLSIVLGVLIFFGRKVLSDLLDNRKQRILNDIRNSEEVRDEALQKLEKARAGLRKAKMKADRCKVNAYSDIEQDRLNKINSTYKTLKEDENYQNETILFEYQKAITQIRQRVVQQALEGALETLKNSLTKELHLRIISANIGILGEIKEITD